MSTNEVLLMTACINVKATQDVAVRDSRERLIQYITSLVAWIKLTDVPTIIFCENTNTSYDFSKIIQFAKIEGKTLEVLIFDDNEGAQKYGKGYGEGKIIKHALENSKYLSNQTNFYKITGRLFVPGFSNFQKEYANSPNVFSVSPFDNLPDDHIWVLLDSKQPKNLNDHLRKTAKHLYTFLSRGRAPHKYTNLTFTAFYKCNVAFYKKYLMHSYKRINEKKTYCMEHVFYEDLLGKDFRNFPISKACELIGVSGGTGNRYFEEDYSEDIKKIAMSFC